MSKNLTIKQLQNYLKKHDAGVFKQGGHDVEDGEFCALEAYSACKGLDWTDSPEEYDLMHPGLASFCRCANDNPSWPSDRARTNALLELVVVWDNTWDLELYIDEDYDFTAINNLSLSKLREEIQKMLKRVLTAKKIAKQIEMLKNL